MKIVLFLVVFALFSVKNHRKLRCSKRRAHQIPEYCKSIGRKKRTSRALVWYANKHTHIILLTITIEPRTVHHTIRMT